MRLRISFLVLAVTSMVVVAFLIPLGLLIREQAKDRALAGAQRTAQSVAAGIAVAATISPEGITAAVAETVVAISDPLDSTTVFLADGSSVGTPADQSPAVATARTGVSLTTAAGDGIEVLVPVAGTGGTSVVRTFLPSGELTRGVGRAWLTLGVLGMALIAAGVLLADRLGRSTVRPIIALAGAAHAMGDGDLEARVDPAGPPEVAELGHAFNELAGRLDDLMAAERESVADLSHRLRTPLTSLRLQAETLADAEASARLLEDVDRLGRQIDQLITEARRRPGTGPRHADLARIADDKSSFWAVLAEEQGRTFMLRVPNHQVPIALPPADAADAVEALLENVYAHTPAGSAYRVTVATRGPGPALVVEDAGPGFPDGFLPGRGISHRKSTGLGLDIAMRAARRSGGEAKLDRSPDLGGARVTLTFGPA